MSYLILLTSVNAILTVRSGNSENHAVGNTISVTPHTLTSWTAGFSEHNVETSEYCKLQSKVCVYDRYFCLRGHTEACLTEKLELAVP